MLMLDVGHNPQATRYLSGLLNQLKQKGKYQKVYAVVAMLGDKDISASLLSLKDEIDYWYTGPLSVPRAASLVMMEDAITPLSDKVNCFNDIDEAFEMAKNQASESDLILVFGSFFTVAQIRPQLVAIR